MSSRQNNNMDNARWDQLSMSLIDLCDSIPVREACDEIIKRTRTVVHESSTAQISDGCMSSIMEDKHESKRDRFDAKSISCIKRGISRISARKVENGSSSSGERSTSNAFTLFYPMIESIATNDSVLARALYSLCSNGGATFQMRL